MYTKEQIEANKAKLIDDKHPRSVYYLLEQSLSGKPDKWLYSREFYKELSKLGISIQEWYDKYILGITKEERPKCLVCGREVEYLPNRRSYRQFCGLKCQLHYIQYDSDINKKKSEKISEAYKDDPNLIELRRNVMIQTNNRLWADPNSAFYDPGYRENKSGVASRIFSRPRSESFKESKRTEMLTRIQEHPELTCGNRGIHGFIGVRKCNNHNKIFHRSSFELYWINLLENDDKVNSYNWEYLWIDYYINNQKRIYVPDVLVHYIDHDELQEVKPNFKLDDEITKLKAEAARKWCSENNAIYRFITEDQIFSLQQGDYTGIQHSTDTPTLAAS